MRTIAIVVLSLAALTADARTRAVRRPAPETVIHYRGDAERTGVYNTRGPRTLARIAWQVNIPGGATFTPPVFANGVVYVPTAAGTLAAFDANNGALRFNSVPLGMFFSAPAIAGDEIYISSESRNMHVLSRASGTILRSFTTDDWVMGSPLVKDATIYFGSENGKFFAVDRQTLAQRWQFATPRPIHAPAAFSDGSVFFNNFDTLFALDPANGAERWRVTREGHIWMALTVTDGVVYAALSGGDLYAFDARTGAEKWHVAPAPGVSGWHYLTILNGMMFATSDVRQLVAFEAATGRVLWMSTLSEFPTEPFIADAVIYTGTGTQQSSNHDLQRRVYAHEAATGRELGSTLVTGHVAAGPAVGDGRLYVVTSKGILYAIED